jgi:hypothetical protein
MTTRTRRHVMTKDKLAISYYTALLVVSLATTIVLAIAEPKMALGIVVGVVLVGVFMAWLEEVRK